VSRSRRLVVPLLMAGLVLPSAQILAQDDAPIGWSVSDDGLVFATNDVIEPVPGLRTLEPGEYPTPLDSLRGPDKLYRVEGTLETGTRVARLLDDGATEALEEGSTPVVATALVDDGGATWATGQHVVSFPSGCHEDLDDCLVPQLMAGLIAAAAPAGTRAGDLVFEEPFDTVDTISTSVIDRDGTLYSFGGDSSVSTSVRPRDDGRIVVLGRADIGDDLGGRLRGFDALVIDADPASARPQLAELDQPLRTRAREVREAGADPDGVNRRVLDCPASGHGIALGQYLITDLGRNAGPALDLALRGGIPVLVSDVVIFDCGPALEGYAPAGGPRAAFVCASTSASPQPFSSTRNGQTVTSPSSLTQQWAVVTLGLDPGAAAFLNPIIDGVNDGEIFFVDLEGVQLDSSSDQDAVLWLGESQVGIGSHGPKRFLGLRLTVDGTTFDLSELQRNAVGEAFDVGPSQRLEANCPGFHFTPAEVDTIFPDGFESVDVAAWAYPTPD
jgi:hypothetical protein